MPTQRKYFYRPAPTKPQMARKIKKKEAPVHSYNPRLFNRKEEPLNYGVTVMFSERQIEEFEKVAEERKWSRGQAIRELALAGLQMLAEEQGG